MQTQALSRPASIWRPWLSALALWLALALLATFALWHLRGEILAGQTRELGLLSLALTDEADRGLRGAEEGLQALRSELREGRLPLTGNEATRSLSTRARLMPLVQTLWLAGSDGRVIATSDATDAPNLTTFLPALDRLTADAMSVSHPFGEAGRPAMVALAVRIDKMQGLASGWILASMPASALLGAFGAAVPAADARMSVLRSDGTRLAGANLATPVNEVEAKQPAISRPNMQVRKFPDGGERLVAQRSIERYGITVLVSREVSSLLESWREAAQVLGVALALLLAIMAAAVHVVQGAQRKHWQAQQSLQAQQSRASKLEALGTMAGGVAHDFNNVLAAVVGYGEMAQDAAPPDSNQARHLDRVLQAALRGKTLIERILAFSPGAAQASTVFELEPVVEEVLAMLAASLRPGVVVERGLEAHGARLRGDPTQAFRAVMNLCTNAMQAMPEGGMLSVQLRRERVASARVLSHSALAAGDYLSLVVSDQGVGITPEVMERLFEPFFTTRSAQSGTGLGLAMVHGIVAEFGGAIGVQSTSGQGARFTLYLSECKELLSAPEPVPVASPTGDGQTLLVVDDDPMLVNLTEEMLKGLGYQPVGFSDPVAALRSVQQDAWRFSAVITDELMPVLSGTELANGVALCAPQIPVLLVSGYGGANLAERAAKAGIKQVLAKPLQRAQIAHALAELLR